MDEYDDSVIDNPEFIVVKEETIDNKHYVYYDNGAYDIEEYNPTDKSMIKSSFMNNDGKTFCYYKSFEHGDGSYERYSYEDNQIIESEIKTIVSPNHSLITNYDANGKVRSTIDSNNGSIYREAYDVNGNIMLQEKDNRFCKYYTYRNNFLAKTAELDKLLLTCTEKTYNGNYVDEYKFNGKKLISLTKYYKDDVISSDKYDYYDNGRVSNHVVTKNVADLKCEQHYEYDENGDFKVSSKFFKNNEPFIQFDGFATDLDYVDDNGIYCFKNDIGGTLYVDSNGKRKYASSYNSNFPAYELHFDSSNNCHIIYVDNNGEEYKRINGTYITDEKGNIVFTSENNEIYEYNSFGQLTKEEINGVVHEYDLSKYSQKVNNTYTRINHIDFDEEAYEAIMKGLISIGDEYPQLINKDCDSIQNTINEFEDKYYGNVNEIKSGVQDSITSITDLKESINYSLLTYSMCDKSLEEKTRVLIDSLFDESEKQLACVFKSNLNKYLEDSNHDKILEYKSDTNFIDLNNLLPIGEYTDDNGNIWYYNRKYQLLNVVGENPTIKYGDAEFKVEINEDGIFKLIDTDGNPLNIYGDYNLASYQYGANQIGIYDPSCLNNENIQRILDKHFDGFTYEEKRNYLNKVASEGCAYVAMTNFVFKEFEGHEEEFDKTFGYPMYSLTLDPEVIQQSDNKVKNGISVDYNYEPMVVDLFCAVNKKNKAIAETEYFSRGAFNYDNYSMYKYIQEEYNALLNVDYNGFVTKNGLFGDIGYSLYNMDGNLFIPYGGSHAMTKIEELEDGRWIVSTWGRKMICETNHPRDFTVDYSKYDDWKGNNYAWYY